MAVDMFLELDGIKGEAFDSKHKDLIEVDSFSFGVHQQGTASRGSGVGAGKADFQDVHFTKRVDKASPPLMLACATGKHIPKGILHVRKAGGEQLEYYTVEFADLIVSSFNNTGHHDGDVPTEEFTMNYSKIVFTYKPQNKDGTLGGPSTSGYNIRENKSV